jgi:diguanylate cyclase (GGDEF)-like protein
MLLDLPTSFVITGFTFAVAGGLLLQSWLHHRNIPALALWALSFVLASIATALIAARGQIPDSWSIVIANALLAMAYGTLWAGMRNFEGRRPLFVATILGTLIWLFACLFHQFYDNPTARAALMAAIGVAYTLLTARELWRGRREMLISRWPIIIILIAHAVAVPLRIPLVATLAAGEPLNKPLLGVVLFESLVLAMCGAYLFGSLASERIAHWYRQDALVDPLTGVPNRRAFMNQGERLLRRAGVGSTPVALLLFDLDRFKSINDRFGHSAGDRVLIEFCRVASAQLRPHVFLARTGGEERRGEERRGEEFACLLADTSQQDATAVAERVRVAFEKSFCVVSAQTIMTTVSIGVAVSGPADDLASLMLLADRALYAAKSRGRNRVVTDQPRPPALAAVPRTA